MTDLAPPAIGHNSGQVAEAGFAWRRHVWTKARKDLVGVLPVEVVRLRVARAKELCLPYKTYAGIRASSGHDLIGFLFSSNALGVLRNGQGLSDQAQTRLAQMRNARRTAVAHRPINPTDMLKSPVIDHASRAPAFTDTWSELRDRIKAIATDSGHPADRFVLVGDTAFEREWAEAGQLAGFLDAAGFFRDDATL